MDPTLKREIISILDDADDMTIATVREDGYPQATTVSYVNEGLTMAETPPSPPFRNASAPMPVTPLILPAGANVSASLRHELSGRTMPSVPGLGIAGGRGQPRSKQRRELRS